MKEQAGLIPTASGRSKQDALARQKEEAKSGIVKPEDINKLKTRCRDILKITKEKSLDQIDSIIDMLEKIENSLGHIILVKNNFEQADPFSPMFKAFTERKKEVEKKRREINQNATKAREQAKLDIRNKKNQEKLAKA